MERDILNLSERLVKNLQACDKKIATAESCTGGLISAAITAIGGSSEVFDMGLCSYANSAKINLLGVSDETLDKYGAVSYNTAAEMAKGVQSLARADYALSVTGIAGPSGGTADKPVGTVYICCKYGETAKVLHLIIKGDRQQVRRETVRQALILANDFVKK